MNKRKNPRLLSLIICIILVIAHFNAITSYAAPLGNNDSIKIIQAIQNTQQGNSNKFYSNLMNSSTVYIRSFKITNLEPPTHGKLLDNTATVVADNGVSWDVPVIWVDKDGDIVHVAIEIDDVIRSYPIIVFYMPEEYSLMFGETASYNVEMPDFVVALMRQNGVTALSVPDAGRTYISTFLPGADKLKINYANPIEEIKSSDNNENKIITPDNSENTPTTPIDPVVPPPAPTPTPTPAPTPTPTPTPVPDPLPGPTPGSYLTPQTDNETTPPDPGLTNAEKIQVTNAHCDQNTIDTIGVDKLAALITWVKTTLEPEATNLLVSKFPAYKEAASNNELGKSIGLYIYYDYYEDNRGNQRYTPDTLAMVNGVPSYGGDYKYRVSVNASNFYNWDANKNEWVFDGTTNYSVLDNTLVHEMMHAFMDDYTRTGMTGLEEIPNTNPTAYTYNTNLEFPTWFVEGMASSVDNTFQYRYDSIHDTYNTGSYNYGYDKVRKKFDADALKQSYAHDTDIQINGSGGEGCYYISGYLACIYLGYLAAKHLGPDAVSGDKVDSSVILTGENYILKQLHDGETLDSIIETISKKADGTSMYTSTSNFERDFIRDTSGADGGASAEFCATLLNYFQQNSTDTSYANGSILLDFADNNDAQLHLSLLNQTQNVYIPTDNKQFAYSTVDDDVAYASGGTSRPSNTSPGKAGTSNTAIGSVAKSTSETENLGLDNIGKLKAGSKIKDEEDLNVIAEEDSSSSDSTSECNTEYESLSGTYNYSSTKESTVNHDSAETTIKSLFATTKSTGSDINSITDAISHAISEVEPINNNTETANNSLEALAPNTDSETGLTYSLEESSDSSNSQVSEPDNSNIEIESENHDNVGSETETSQEASNTSNEATITEENSSPTTTEPPNATSETEQTDSEEASELDITEQSPTNDTSSSDSNQLDVVNSDTPNIETEEVIEVTVEQESPSDQDSPIQNPIIISEDSSDDDNTNSEESSSEEILDVIPENHSDDENEDNDNIEPEAE